MNEIRLWLLHSPVSQPPGLPCSPGRLGLSHVLIVSVENLQMGGPSLWDSPMANGVPCPASPAGRDAKVCNPGFSMIRLNRSKIVMCGQRRWPKAFSPTSLSPFWPGHRDGPSSTGNGMSPFLGVLACTPPMMCAFRGAGPEGPLILLFCFCLVSEQGREGT